MASVKQTPLQHLVECPICMEDKDVPKQFPCRHTICLECISKLPMIQGKVTCPLCRAECTIPARGPSHLPTNLTIVQLKDIIGCIKDETRNQCEYCDERFATHFCTDCEDNICSDCVMMHKNKKHFKDHQTVPISTEMCKDHSKLFTFFCLDCKMLLCQVCLHADSCGDHNVQTLDELKQSKVNEMQNLIGELYQNIQKNVETIQTANITLTSNLNAVRNIQIQIKEHTQTLMTNLKQRERELLSETEKYKKEMLALKSEVNRNDNLDKLYHLKETAEASLAAGIQQILLTLPSLTAALQSYSIVKSVNKKINKTIQFDKQETLTLGSIQHIMNTHEHGQQDNASQGAMEGLYMSRNKMLSLTPTSIISPPVRENNLACNLLWEKANAGSIMCDVIFTTDFRIAVTQWETSVLLFNQHGNVLADSKDLNTNLEYENGICFHTKYKVLLVSDRSNYLILLEPETPIEERQVKLDDLSPSSIAMLSNGHIVITDVAHGAAKLGLFDVNGSRIHLWKHYSKGYNFQDPTCITTDSMDNIFVSDSMTKRIIKLGQTEEMLCEWSTEGRPCGLAVYGDKVLVAERCSPPESPDCLREYNINGGQGIHLITWDRSAGFGALMSVATYKDHLVILGS